MNEIVEKGKEVGEKAKALADAGVEKLKKVDWKAQGGKAKSMAEDGVEKLKHMDWKAQGEVAAEKAKAAKEKIQATWRSGTKGKVICVAIAALILWVGSCLFGGGPSSSVDFKELSTDAFSTIFISKMIGEESGVAYRHDSNPGVQVVSVDGGGVLVAYVKGTSILAEGFENFVGKLGGDMDKVVYVVTDVAGYTDGTPLRDGYYVRKGTCAYKNVCGAKRTVPLFVEVRDSGVLAKCRRIEEDRQRQITKAALKEEGSPIDVKVPVKSLCGFVLGSTPSQSWKLFKENVGRPFTHVRDMSFQYKMKGTLLKPFRMFTRGNVEYTFVKGVPERMYKIELESEEVDFNNVTKESCIKELNEVKKLIEQKFDIELKERCNESDSLEYSWKFGGTDDYFGDELITLELQRDWFRLVVWCKKVESICEEEKQRNKREIKFAEGSGLDQL